MTHRSTIVTRIRTEEGVVGEAYCGDEDAGLLEIDEIVRTEIAPRLIGEDAFRVERCWELARPATFDILRDRRLGLVATACVDAAIWDAIGKALGQPLHRLWGGYRESLPVITIGGYYGRQDIAEEVSELREQGLAGMKFKVGGLTPEEDAARFRTARAAAGPGLRPLRRRQPGLDAGGGGALRTTRRGPRSVLVRGALHLVERPAGDARRPLHGRRTRLRGAERVLGGRVPRPDGRRRDRLLQLRLVLVRRRNRVASGRGGRPLVRRGDGPPRGAPDRLPSAGLDPTRDVPRGVQRRA